MTKETTCLASAQSDARSSNSGSSDTGKCVSPESSTDSLLPTLTRLAIAMETQNEALWALVHQTAAMVSLLVESVADEEDDDGSSRYLDGTRVS